MRLVVPLYASRPLNGRFLIKSDYSLKKRGTEPRFSYMYDGHINALW